MIRKRKIQLAITIGLLIIVAALAVGGYYYTQHVKSSPLYEAVSAYQQGEQEWIHPEESYAEGTGEALFLQGMDAFVTDDFEKARALFEEAAVGRSSDPALSAYVYYYITLCQEQLEGAGDPEIVALALDAAGQYAPIANDTDVLWNLISSISLPDESAVKAIALLETYLEDTEKLELTTWVWTKNCIAMLEYNNKEYARSIRNFYDVEVALATEELTPELEIELRYAREYIANIYFIFEDHEEAAKMYQELIDETLDDDTFHAYGCSINMASAYLEIDDTENARKAMVQLQENLPRVEENVRAEVEASMNDVFANICLAEDNYADADAFLNKAEAYYQDGAEGSAFLGGKIYIDFTRCKYLAKTGSTTQAQHMMEEMVSNTDAAYYGLEKELYEALQEIYQQTGQTEKLVDVQQVLLDLDEDFAQTVQREYLEFSAYYQESNQLRAINLNLSWVILAAIIWIVVILIILIIVLLLVRLLRTRNVTDQLTGVYNRKKLLQLKRKYRRAGTPGELGVIMMDIDYFKRYNDTYGHPAGDKVLKEVADVLKTSVRSKDLVIRYGGEEFLVFLYGVKGQTAQAVCERIHQQLAARAIPHEASEVSGYVTLSMGLHHQDEAGGAALDDLIRTADRSLYRSKEAGRNRTTWE